jgi:hypothetical protein
MTAKRLSEVGASGSIGPQLTRDSADAFARLAPPQAAKGRTSQLPGVTGSVAYDGAAGKRPQRLAGLWWPGVIAAALSL